MLVRRMPQKPLLSQYKCCIFMGVNPNLLLMEFAQVTENGVGMHKIGGSVRASRNLAFWGAKLKVTSREQKNRVQLHNGNFVLGSN